VPDALARDIQQGRRGAYQRAREPSGDLALDRHVIQAHLVVEGLEADDATACERGHT
jgi:hypothetical protein